MSSKVCFFGMYQDENLSGGREMKILGSCKGLRRLNMRCYYERPLYDDRSALEIKKTTM